MRLEPSLRYRQNLPANPPMFVTFFNRQIADGDDGMTLIGKNRWKSVLTLVCCTHVVLVNYQGLQSETLFRPWGIYVFPYGLICFFCVYSYASQELLLPYCDIKSGSIEKDGSTVPRTQGMRSSAEGFQEVIEVHVIHQILWLKLTYCSRWWFQIFFIFTPIWGRFPIW